MVAKCLDDNKPKIHLKSEFALFQNFKISKFHLICHMLTKFSGFNPKGPYPTLEKEKETICVVFTYSVKRARKIRKFHVAVVQRRLRNVQKKKREETCKVVVLLTKPIGFWFLVFVLFCYFSFFLSFFFFYFIFLPFSLLSP